MYASNSDKTNNNNQTNQDSFVLFKNGASIVNSNASNNGGSFYIDHSLFDIYMNTSILANNCKALTGKGGVFYLANARNVEIYYSQFFSFKS